MPGWDGLYLFEVAGMNYFRNVEDETVLKWNHGCIIYTSESFPLEVFDFRMDVVDRPWKNRGLSTDISEEEFLEYLDEVSETTSEGVRGREILFQMKYNVTKLIFFILII